MSEGQRPTRAWVPWALLAPGLAWLMLFFVVPLLSLGQDSLKSTRSWPGGLSNFSKVFSDNAEVIIRTFVFALFATILAILVGYPLAYFIAMRGGRWRSVLLLLVVLPFFTTYLIRTIAWRVLLFDDGPIASLLKWSSLMSRNGSILATNQAVVGALLYNFLPFMILPIYVSIDRIDRRLFEAAPDLYASDARTFRQVTLPLSLPGVFAGSLLTFIPAAGDFVNAELLGGDRQRMIGNVIEQNFVKEVFRPGMSALSFVLMLLIVAGVLLYARLLGTEELG